MMDGIDNAVVLLSIFCGVVFLYYLVMGDGFVMLAWGGAFILSLVCVKEVLERESVRETREKTP